MFNFFDMQQNPFLMMMNMEDVDDADTAEDMSAEGFSYGPCDMDPMRFMQQAFMMHMQMMQMMQNAFMMPMKLMTSMMDRGASDKMSGVFENMTGKHATEKDGENDSENGFKLGGISIPPALIGKLMQMDMSPEDLEKLQKVLDFVLEFMPSEKDGHEEDR